MATRCRAVSKGQLTNDALVIAPHFDDETLGCGGTIVRKLEAGAAVNVAFMTDGAASHSHHLPPDELRDIRRREADAATRVLGLKATSISCAELPDGMLGAHQTDAVDHVAELIERLRPAELYVPHLSDGQDDHRATTTAALEARALTGSSAEVFEYPVWHWQQWPWVRLASPLRRHQWRGAELHGPAWRRSASNAFGLRFARSVNRFVDISGATKRKRSALDCYTSQMVAPAEAEEWATLHDVSYGDFLRRLLDDREYFRCTNPATYA